MCVCVWVVYCAVLGRVVLYLSALMLLKLLHEERGKRKLWMDMGIGYLIHRRERKRKSKTVGIDAIQCDMD